MAAPHISGIVALMAQKNASLRRDYAEDILESTAIPLAAPECRTVTDPVGKLIEQCWGDNATGKGLDTADAAFAATPKATLP